MSAYRVCPQCDKPLPSDGPHGQCPQCLLKAALPGQSLLESAPNGFRDSSAMAIAPEAGVRINYFGDYELLEEIARGSMGVVWKAKQTSLNREVALKMIRAGRLAGLDEVERFLREAEAAANLQHPNIVAIHEVGEHGGQHYFSMEYVAGRDLGAIVKDGPLAPRVSARYVKIVAEAIQFAHQRGTLHRDLKPQNVLIDSSDQPRITDFGLAKIMKDDGQLTQSGIVMGSPSYMPPEQAAGRHGDIGPASDVYSLGAMLYELLTGRPPFRGATATATLRDVMELDPIPPRSLKPDIAPDLETICLKCLEKSPSSRYPTARALAEELERYLKDEPIQAKPASSLRKAVSWVRRHPGTLATLAAIIVVGLAFGVIYLFEENAFLRAQQADPTLTRILGPRHETLQTWNAIGFFGVLAGFFAFITVHRAARGLTWNQKIDLRRPFKPEALDQPIRPLDDRMWSIGIVASAIMLGFGVVLLVLTIRAYVWEGESIGGQFFPIYSLIYFGILTVGLLVRDYRLVQYGIAAAPQPTAEQIESIVQALENFDYRTAIARYRQAIPDGNAMQANDYVVRLWQKLRTQYPDRFATPQLSLRRMNWKAMGVGAALEAIFLAALWVAGPPAEPTMAISQFATTFLFGMGAVACPRTKGLWRRVLMLVPAIVAMVLSEFVVPLLFASSTHSIGLYICGFIFGIILMVSGFQAPQRKR